MQNLKDKYPETYKVFVQHGYESLCRMMVIFTRQSDMDLALETNSAVHNWMNLKNIPIQKYESKAQRYFWKLEENDKKMAKNVTVSNAPTPKSEPVEQVKEDTLFLVSVPKAKTSKVEAVLKMLNCEVVSI